MDGHLFKEHDILPYGGFLIVKMIVQADSKMSFRTISKTIWEIIVGTTKTNIPMLRDILKSDLVQRGGVEAHFLETGT
ncbi:hypothetical protein [Cohaesibacter celericrescens]|uniref:Uncharacterized protein n=1 Tax=Cohaesibacter celericrescens TaxID=2067669 RepID=A0A2N5XVR3_9HYPH|nr:hypothetical protein [Cohaesibacter celericrescens]PLW78596.1 hypothetical protein C0081_03815 [Cohaesibacter celericrescens]